MVAKNYTTQKKRKLLENKLKMIEAKQYVNNAEEAFNETFSGPGGPARLKRYHTQLDQIF